MWRRNNGFDRRVEHRVVCPNCDLLTVAIVDYDADHYPAVIACEGCGYSEIKNGSRRKSG